MPVATVDISSQQSQESQQPFAMVHNDRRARRKRSKKSAAQGAAANSWAAKSSKEARRGDEACVSGAAGRDFRASGGDEIENNNNVEENDKGNNNNSSNSSSNGGRSNSCSSDGESEVCSEKDQPLQHDEGLAEPMSLTDESIARLIELLAREPDYHPKTDFLFRINSASEDKVDARLRDEAIYNLRFLHKFYNLSPECFAHAVNIADRFVVKVKVKPKYMACLATAAYLIAAKMIEDQSDWPVPEKLVCMARCGGSANDLERMEVIIRNKLRDQRCLEEAATPLHFLLELQSLFPSVQAFQRAVGELETSLCSVAVYEHRPCVLALAIARKHLLAAAGPANRNAVDEVLSQLCDLFQLSPDSLSEVDAAISGIVSRLQTRTPAPRLLVWAVSRRTLVSLMRPSAQASLLDPIRED
ncbi:hypothetical protein BOX15_Mlig014800g1 [Macrostomum lignano]|uniref:Cyclin-like domain-containing protein n=1 Tax=Macrostomum lignano TaxID=282301 RepID=A0A267GDU1_9PLAT|nr:hypothetical protein BOX15_Mlig014800g1 [Macrostomum lignano]